MLLEDRESASADLSSKYEVEHGSDKGQGDRLQVWEEFGHQFQEDELDELQQSIVEMALSRVDGVDGLFVGGLWALRRSDSLTERHITHVLSLVPFQPAQLKNFKDETWTEYGRGFQHLVIDVHDVDDEDLLVELPKAVKFIHEGLGSNRGRGGQDGEEDEEDEEEVGQGGVQIGSLKEGIHDMKLDAGKASGAVFVHCAAGKSRSAAVVIAYLLWRYPERFNPNLAKPRATPTTTGENTLQAILPRRETAKDAVAKALSLIRQTRPMAEPNDGFMDQLALWWEMGCPEDVENHPLYQRWSYKREVQENTAIGQAPSRLRFEDEEQIAGTERGTGAGVELRCKKCRRTLATAPFIIEHSPKKQEDGEWSAVPISEIAPSSASASCQHVFIEPLSWMRSELEKGELNGRLLCPNAKCTAGVGRYDWKGFKCSCGDWVCPAFSLQRGRVDEVVRQGERQGGQQRQQQQMGMGIRMPPGMRGQGGNL